MHLPALLVSLYALCVAVTYAQLTGDVSSVASDAGIDLSEIPVCFSTCAGQAAASKDVGCGSILNFTCICTTPSFSTAVSQCLNTTLTNDCPTQSKNETALADNTAIFAQICKPYSGDSTNSTNHTATTAPSTASTTKTKSENTTSSTSSGSNAGYVVTPTLSHVVLTVATILSVLLFGAISVL